MKGYLTQKELLYLWHNGKTKEVEQEIVLYGLKEQTCFLYGIISKYIQNVYEKFSENDLEYMTSDFNKVIEPILDLEVKLLQIYNKEIMKIKELT